MGGTSLFVAFYLQSVQALSPFHAALWLLPQMIAMIIGSNLGPWLGRRVDPQPLVVASLSMMTAGFVLYAVIPDGRSGLFVVAAGAMLATAGIGAVFPFLMHDVISHAPQERAGSDTSGIPSPAGSTPSAWPASPPW